MVAALVCSDISVLLVSSLSHSPTPVARVQVTALSFAVDVTDDDAHESESSCAAHDPAGAEEEAAARERRERQWVALELGTEVQREPLT